MSLPRANTPFGPIDQVYVVLRGGALVVGVAYAYMAKAGAAVRDDVLLAFAVFAAYGALLYTAGLPWLRDRRRKHRFYATLGAFDLLFVIALMYLTGGADSPFYRGLYLWVAMPAFYFGLRTGTIASAVAFVVFVALFDSNDRNAWDFLIQAGGLLLHGPIIGWLVERNREREARLEELEARLAETGQTRVPTA
ncbi:MAG: hypothetical protein PVI30_21620 [Myxococcales bacterium]|jgi:hypothetical protein